MDSVTSADNEEGATEYQKDSIFEPHPSISSAVDERSIQEEYRRLSEAKSRRTIDARRYVKDTRIHPQQSY